MERLFKRFEFDNLNPKDRLIVTRLPIGPRGEMTGVGNRKIRNRLLAIGFDIIGDSTTRLVIAYSKGSEMTTQGYHDDLVSVVNGFFIDPGNHIALHASITSIKECGESHHVIEIFKKHPEDVIALGGEDELKKRSFPWELGSITPEAFITAKIAQNLMHDLGAIRLDIVYGQPTNESYNLRRLVIKPLTGD